MKDRLCRWLPALLLLTGSLFAQLGRAAATAAPTGTPAQAIDSLTGPIALYPDALIAQILDASTNPAEVQDFGGWLKQHSNLKGSQLQEAASKAGFDAAFIALALFPDVVQMMAQKIDWTKQLGEAFKSNAKAVSDSIQRLRKQAQSLGNLKTNKQQEVVTQKASSGEQVIVIQPANPQVVYVPQYNPQVVYVQAAPPPPPPSAAATAGAGLIGFTAGVIVGAATHNNNYYCGPYAWARPPVPAPYAYNYNNAAALQQQRYNAANLQRQQYNNAAALQQQRYNNATNLQNQREANYQQNSAQRQANYQQNSTDRQAAVQSNQSQRQSAVQANQAQRQAAATSSGASGQAASQRSGMASGGLSGYQNAAAARSESQRGSRSLEGSRSGRRR